MLSAGQTQPPAPTQQTPQSQPVSPYTVNPIAPISGPTANYNVDLPITDANVASQLLTNQSNLQSRAMWINTGVGAANAILNFTAMVFQDKAIGREYDLRTLVVNNAYDIEMRRCAVQEEGMDCARDMQAAQNSHEQKLAQMNNSLQITLTNMTEKYKQQRFDSYMVNKYFMGEPIANA